MSYTATWDAVAENDAMPRKTKTVAERLNPWLTMIMVACTILTVGSTLVQRAGTAMSLGDVVRRHTDQIFELQKGQDSIKSEIMLMRSEATASSQMMTRDLGNIGQAVQKLAAQNDQILPQLRKVESDAMVAKEKANNALAETDGIKVILGSSKPEQAKP